jgi:alcohol dehydrogenase
MAIQEMVYGFYIPGVALIGIGAAKQIPEKTRH